MKKKLIRKLLNAIALAGTVLAGFSYSYAQSSGSSSSAPATRPIDPDPSGPVKILPAPSQPIPRPPPATDGPVYNGPPGTIAPIAPGDPAPRPLPPGERMPPAGTSPGTDAPRTAPADRGVVLVGPPAQDRPLPAGTVIPPGATAPNTGVRVIAGDIVRAGSDTTITTGTPPATGTPTPVTTLVQQFDAQRSQELASRAATLEQLRTATPAQRDALIADLQAATQRQATEQREAARDLRRELRTMREERKGK